MRKIASLILSIVFVASTLISFGQDDNEDYKMVEVSFMKPKVGKEDAFKKAVKAHNKKYHASGPHMAELNLINSGISAGTYAWVMGPCMMKDLDTRPGEGAHNDDWQKNVVPYIESYGPVEYWRQNEKLTYIPENMPDYKVMVIWFLDIKRGEYYRFKKIMADIRKVHEANGTTNMLVWENVFNENNGRDVALEWLKTDFAALDGGFNMKKEYEKMYGEDTWDQVLDEWEEIVVSVKREMWTKED